MANPVISNIDGSNPGPAGVTTLNTQLIVGAQNQPNVGSGVGQGTNMIRLLAVGRSIPINTTGDVAVLPLINCQSFTIPNITGFAPIVACNPLVAGAFTSVASTVFRLWSGPAGTGQALIASTTLSSLSATTAATYIQEVASTATGYYQTATWGVGQTSGIGGAASNYIYVNVGTASGVANSTIDLFIYGVDLT